MGWAEITLMLTLLLPRAGRKTLSLAPLALPVAPFVILWALSQLSSVADAFSRAGGTDTQTAVNRIDVWHVVFDYLRHGNPQT